MYHFTSKIRGIIVVIILSCTPGLVPAEILMQPYLQAVTTNSIYVMVECSTTDTVTVSYGTSLSFGEIAKTKLISTTTSTTPTYVHKIQLTGLQSNTLYYYMASQGSSASSAFTFTTAVGQGTPFRMAWMADCRTGTGIHDQISSLIATYDPRFSCYGGDYCATSSYSSWKSEFFRNNELNLISHVPFFPAIGNHESWGTNSKAFTRSPDSPSNTQDYYSFDYGDVHFLCINNQVAYSTGSAQYNFAQSDLASSTKPWKIVFFHNPAYCSGGHGEDAGMKVMSQNIFVPQDVDLVLTGHSHFYQHNYVDGIHHMVIGDAGAPPTTPAYAPYTILSVQDYEFAIIDVTGTSLALRVYNNNNQRIDSIKLVKPASSSGPLSGIKTVGPSPGDFISLTQAFEYLRTEGNGICGPLVLELNQGYSSAAETFPLTLNSIEGTSSTNTITIRPQNGSSGVTISSDNHTGTLNLNGINYLIIDGRAGGSGPAKLTIENLDASGYSVQFLNDASNNTIRYCTIKGINSSTASGVVFLSTTTLTTGNDNNLIDHCILRDGSSVPVYLLYSKGTSGAANSSNTISNCELFNFSSSAVYLSGTGNGNSWSVTGNSFYNNMAIPLTSNITVIRFGSSSSINNLISGNYIGGQSSACGGSRWPVNGSAAFYGIWVTSANVTRNKIANIGSTQSGSAPLIYGIYNYGGNTTTNEFTDNMISLDGGVADNPVIYGFYDDVSTGGGCNLFYNSISIYGSASVSSSTYAVRFNSNSLHNLKDNIFSNERLTGGSGSHYAIYCSGSAVFSSDYNDLFSAAGSLGFFNSSSVATLSDWQTTTGSDGNSVSLSPSFSSPEDLHIQWDERLDGKGITIPDQVVDFDGNTRGTPPDPGINEFSLTRVWTGNLSSNWSDPGNWSPVGVPVLVQDVIILSGMNNNPVIANSGILCHNLTINAGASLTISSGVNATITGNFNIPDGATFVNLGKIEIQGTLYKFP
jgi:hypothetical protein